MIAGLAKGLVSAAYGRNRGRRSRLSENRSESSRAALAATPHAVLVLAGLTGLVTGLAVSAFSIIADDLLRSTVAAPLALQVAIPTVGLAVSALLLRLGGRGTSSSTSDEYIRCFHDPVRRLDLRPVVPRLAAAVATLGSGAPLGYEGPSLYCGAAIGSAWQRRLAPRLGPERSKVLLVTGAAAGVAAVFKAPVTGLVFALEVPFQDDLAHRMLLPAAVSSGASYLVFAAVAGTVPILPISGAAPFNLVDLGGAAAIGLLAGALARAFARAIREAKRAAAKRLTSGRIAVSGAVLAATVVAAHQLGEAGLALGPGYDALRWALDPGRALPALAVLGTIRALGAAASVAGGGVGGLFIPLVVQGALCGRIMAGVLGTSGSSTLFPVVGMAAFLGAGYRVPLASVVFVAEFTGRPGFVIPGLIAAVVAQLVMGRSSVSAYQAGGRTGHLEARLGLPLGALVDAEARVVPPDATVEELFWQHFVGTRQQAVAVVDGSRYVGLALAEDLAPLDRREWSSTAVRAVMRQDIPVASTEWLLSDAARTMEDHDTPILGVCDDGRFLGIISAQQMVNLEEVLERTVADRDPVAPNRRAARWRSLMIRKPK